MFAAQKHSLDIDRKREVSYLFGGLHRIRVLSVADAGIVEKDMEPPESLFGGLDHRPPIGMPETSATITNPWPPASSISATVAETLTGSISTAPSEAKSRAVRRPIPDPAPVIKATLPPTLMRTELIPV